MPAHCLTRNGSSQHPYFRYFSFCQASHPFNVASDYLPVIHSNSPSANFSLCTFQGSHFAVLCALLDMRKNALKRQEKSLIPHFCGTVAKRNNFRETSAQSQWDSVTHQFSNFFSNSNPLNHLSLETKYCELKPDIRLEYQMYLLSFSEAA